MAKINQHFLKLLAVAILYPTQAFAGPTAFDCDVPADNYSSVSQDVSGPMKIEGSIQLVRTRSGANLPVAGARLVSSDGNNSVGFQLVVPSSRATRFDVILNTKRGDDMKRATVTQLATEASVPFSLSISDAGKVAFAIGGKDFNADFIPFSAGKAMAFCSTAQFKFTGLLFHQDSAVIATSIH